MTQAKGCAVTTIYTFVVTLIICFIIDKTIGMRASAEDEIIGLDLSQHHERAYTILD
jgi:Amt family ammonium transporter